MKKKKDSLKDDLIMILPIITGLAIVFVTLFIFGCASFDAGNIAVYEGAAIGYRGVIRVSVAVEDGTITGITVLESDEDRAVGGLAMEELTDLILMYNTTEVDVISGATETSQGFIDAVENAIMQQ